MENLRRGDTGKTVEELNESLRCLGYPAGKRKLFTGDTQRGLTAFQGDRGLPATGEADARSRSLLALLLCDDPGEAFYGDANGDGMLTMEDMGELLLSLLRRKRELPLVRLDADGNGHVDLKDGAYLLKCILGRSTPVAADPYIEPEQGVEMQTLKRVEKALSEADPLRQAIVREALAYAWDPESETVAAFPKSLYLWGGNLYGPDLAPNYPTTAEISLLALKKPAFFDQGRKEMMLQALQNAASLGDKLTGADCSGAVVGIWRKLGLVKPRFDAVANLLLSPPISYPVNRKTLLPGDLVGFDGHVGIYAGDNRAIEWVGGAYGCQLTRLGDRRCWNFTERKLVTMKQNFHRFARPAFLLEDPLAD